MPQAFIKFERRLSGPNEVFTSHGRATPHYRPVLEEIEGMGAGEWDRRVRRAHGRMLEEQLRVGVSSGDRTHPTDYFPFRCGTSSVPSVGWNVVSVLTQTRLRPDDLSRQSSHKIEIARGCGLKCCEVSLQEPPHRWSRGPRRRVHGLFRSPG